MPLFFIKPSTCQTRSPPRIAYLLASMALWLVLMTGGTQRVRRCATGVEDDMDKIMNVVCEFRILLWWSRSNRGLCSSSAEMRVAQGGFLIWGFFWCHQIWSREMSAGWTSWLVVFVQEKRRSVGCRFLFLSGKYFTLVCRQLMKF